MSIVLVDSSRMTCIDQVRKVREKRKILQFNGLNDMFMGEDTGQQL